MSEAPTLRLERIGKVRIPNYPGMTVPGQWAAFLRSGHGFANFAPFFLPNVTGFKPIGELQRNDHWLFRWKQKTWRLRTLRETGVYFSASKSRGTGRSGCPAHYREMFGKIDGFIIASCEPWRDGIHAMNLWKVPIERVWNAYLNGPMHKITGKVTMSRLVFIEDPP